MNKSSRTIWLLGFLLVAAAALAYANSFSGAFLFDDRDSILDNATIRHLAQWRDWMHPPGAGVTVSGRPGINFTLALNYAWSGLNPWSYHLLNLAGHVGGGLILFGLARRTFLKVDSLRPVAPILAWAVALLWTLHPLQTESVTYVVQRAEMLMGLCYLGAMLCFVRAAEAQAEKRPRAMAEWGGACVLVCALGMTCKEVMVSAPVIMLLYDRTFLSGSFAAAWRRCRWLWIALAATWAPLVLGVISTNNRGGTAGFGVGLHAWQYWWTQGPAIWTYFRLAVWPHPLVLDYGFQKEWIQFPWRALPANLAIGALAVLVLGLLRFAPVWGFLGFWFFSILAPTSLIPGNRQTLAEHRMYLALAPLLAAGTVGLWLVVRNRPAWQRGTCGALILVAAAFGLTVHARNQDFSSEEGMWRVTIRQVPNNSYVHTNYGACLYLDGNLAEARKEFARSVELDPFTAAAESDLGMTYQADGKFEEAIRHYERALRIDSRYPQASNNLAVSLASQGRWPEAVKFYRQALAQNPNYMDAHANLGIAERTLGHYAEAEAQLRRALEIGPVRPQTEYDLGLAYQVDHRYPEAAAAYAATLRLMPSFALAQSNWAVTLVLEHKPAEAVAHFDAAIAIDPTNPEVFLNRAIALASLGRVEASVEDYRTAIRLRPTYVDALANLGAALVGLNRAAEAATALKEAVRLSPQNARIHYDYSLALAATGKRALAEAEVAEALRLDPDLSEARNNWAVTLAAEGKLDEAVRQLNEITRRHPDFMGAHQNLVRLYRAMGRTADAEREAKAGANLPVVPAHSP